MDQDSSQGSRVGAIVVTRLRVYACAPNQTCCSEKTEGSGEPYDHRGDKSRVVNDHRLRRAFVIKPASPEKSLDPHCPSMMLGNLRRDAVVGDS